MTTATSPLDRTPHAETMISVLARERDYLVSRSKEMIEISHRIATLTTFAIGIMLGFFYFAYPNVFSQGVFPRIQGETRLVLANWATTIVGWTITIGLFVVFLVLWFAWESSRPGDRFMESVLKPFGAGRHANDLATYEARLIQDINNLERQLKSLRKMIGHSMTGAVTVWFLMLVYIMDLWYLVLSAGSGEGVLYSAEFAAVVLTLSVIVSVLAIWFNAPLLTSAVSGVERRTDNSWLRFLCLLAHRLFKRGRSEEESRLWHEPRDETSDQVP